MSSKYTFGSVDVILPNHRKRKNPFLPIPDEYQPPKKILKLNDGESFKDNTVYDPLDDPNNLSMEIEGTGTEIDPIWIDSDSYENSEEYYEAQEMRLEQEFLKEVDLDTEIYMKYLFPRMMGWMTWKPPAITLMEKVELMEN